MLRNVALVLAGALVIGAVSVSTRSAGPMTTTQTPPPASRPNPLMSPSPLPFGAPPFDKIKDSDYQPAMDAGMAQETKEFEAIANNPEPPTFENTILAMEKGTPGEQERFLTICRIGIIRLGALTFTAAAISVVGKLGAELAQSHRSRARQDLAIQAELRTVAGACETLALWIILEDAAQVCAHLIVRYNPLVSRDHPEFAFIVRDRHIAQLGKVSSVYFDLSAELTFAKAGKCK